MSFDNDKIVQFKKSKFKKQIDDTIDVTPTGALDIGREKAEEAIYELKMINAKHGFIKSFNGKTMISSMVYNEYHRRDIPEFITPETFQSMYSNIPAPEQGEKGGVPPLGKWWLANPYRKEYETATFEPDRPPREYEKDGKLIYNMWEGFSVEPKRGSWKYTIRHIYEILCNKDRAKFKYIMRWLAWCVQHPGEQAEVALIFKGKKGAGKGTILTHFKKLFGVHGFVISNREHLTGKHNAHLQNLVFLFADEAYNPGDREAEGILKNLITEGGITVEPKFHNPKLTRNCLHIAMATNNEWVIPATEDERRYFINQVDNKYAKGESSDYIRDKYFKRLWAELSDEGLSAMLYDLKNMQLGEYHPRYAIPMTEEMKKQIAMSLPKVKTAMFYFLEEGLFPGELQDGKYLITIEALLQHIYNLDQHSYKTISRKMLTSLMTELGITTHRSTFKRHWMFPELGELRKIWSEKVMANEAWDLSATWQVDKPQY